MIKLIKYIWMPIVGLALLLLLWQCASIYDWLGDTVLASPGEVYTATKAAFETDATKDQKFHEHAGYTISMAFWGWILAMFWGLIVGIALGVNKVVFSMFSGILEFFRVIPPIFAFPLLQVAFNYKLESYTWTIVFGCLPIICLIISKGVQSLQNEPVEILKVAGSKRWVVLLVKCIQILPSIFLAARTSFSFSLIIAVVCEMIKTPKNGWALGSLARDAEMAFDAPLFYACVITIGIYGFLCNVIFRKFENFFKNDI